MKEHSIRQIIRVEHWVSIEGPVRIRRQAAGRSRFPNNGGERLVPEMRVVKLENSSRRAEARPDRIECLK